MNIERMTKNPYPEFIYLFSCLSFFFCVCGWGGCSSHGGEEGEQFSGG